MASQFDWSVRLKGVTGAENALSKLQEQIYMAAYDGGATEIAHFWEDVLGFKLDGELKAEYLDADTHYMGTLGMLMLPKNLWNKGMELSRRCFLSGAYYEDNELVVSFYGPDDCSDLMSLIVAHCDYVSDFEITGGEDDEDYDDEYEDDEDYDDEEYEDDEY